MARMSRILAFRGAKRCDGEEFEGETENMKKSILFIGLVAAVFVYFCLNNSTMTTIQATNPTTKEIQNTNNVAANSDGSYNIEFSIRPSLSNGTNGSVKQ